MASRISLTPMLTLLAMTSLASVPRCSSLQIRSKKSQPLHKGLFTGGENINKIPIWFFHMHILGSLEFDFQNANFAIVLNINHLLFFSSIAFFIVFNIFQEFSIFYFFLEFIIVPEKIFFAMGLSFSGLNVPWCSGS